MMQRTALTIAATITAFVLVLIGSVAAYLAQQSTAAPAPTATALADVTTAAPGLDPAAVQQAIKERDAAYQQRIQQANDQLQQANVQLQQAYQKQQELAAQLNQAYRQQQPRQAVAQPEPAPPAPPAAPTYAVSPDIAAAIALGAVPGATLSHAPDLVSFQGLVAYEVVLDRGTIYVDANSGQVLYNGATIAAATGGGGHHHEEGEHEGGGDD
jgi:uncharacterized membrane protein YkoI